MPLLLLPRAYTKASVCIQIVPVAFHKAAARADCQHPADNVGAFAVQVIAGDEEVTLVAAGHAVGGTGTVNGVLHLTSA